MHVSKKQQRTLNKAITNWLENGVISATESQKLKNSYELTSFNWQKLAKYSFWLAIFCFVTSVVFMLNSQWFIEVLMRIFNASRIAKCISLAVLSALFFFVSNSRKNQYPEKIYSNEALFIFAVVTTGFCIAYIEITHDSFLLLIIGIIYAFLGLWFPSKLTWLLSLLLMGIWIQVEASHVEQGFNLLILFGLTLILFGLYAFNQWKTRVSFIKPTMTVGLLYLFVSLWLLAYPPIYLDHQIWVNATQVQLVNWLLLIGTIYLGIKYHNSMAKWLGLLFFLLSLYESFFQHFLEFLAGTNKTVFFAFLALSFWYLSAKAENIWQLRLVKKLTNRNVRKS